MTHTLRPAVNLLATTALALTLGACKIDNRPLLARGGPPPVEAPIAPPLDTAYVPTPGEARAYAYPQRAYAMSRPVYQRPPSYAFGYGEEQPWVWDDGDQGTMFAEPIDDGYRYYYYEPGEAYPYFVQDPDYGYAYGANGGLVALFAATGALIAADHYRDYAPNAERYWTRGYDLDRTYRRSPRYPVEAATWRARGPALVSGHERWFRAAQAQPAWREAYRARGPHGGGHAGREFAAASGPLPSFGPETHGGPGPRREFHGEPGRNGAAFPRAAEPRPGFVEHGPAHGREMGGREIAAREMRGPAAHGPAGHEPSAHGRQAFARAAETHGREVSARGPAPFHASPEAHPQGHGGGHGPQHGGQAYARAAEPHGPGGGHGGGGHGPVQFRAPPQQHAQAQAPQQHGPPGGGHGGGGGGPHGGGQGGGGQHGGGQGGHGGGGHGDHH